MVYFVEGTETGSVKIGVTGESDFRKRFRGIQSSELLVCKAVIKEAYNDGPYHLKFKHLWRHGEWFSPGKDLMEFIASLPRRAWADIVLYFRLSLVNRRRRGRWNPVFIVAIACFS